MNSNNATDIIAFSESVIMRMKERLSDFNPDQEELIKIGENLSFIRGLISELKTFAASYKFKNELVEIKFFKEFKPVLLSQYFYYKKIFGIRLFDSFRDVKSRHTHYYELLHFMERFVKKNHDFYDYCLTNQNSLDRQYFTRAGHNYKSINLDEKFTTGYDTKLARILANELLKKYLLNALHKTQVGTGTTLTWTGPKASLIELIYAIHSVEVINRGNIDIKPIASAFETLFNIDLGDYYRTFQDIRIRKKSQVPFLDALKEKLILRINDAAR